MDCVMKATTSLNPSFCQCLSCKKRLNLKKTPPLLSMMMILLLQSPKQIGCGDNFKIIFIFKINGLFV